MRLKQLLTVLLGGAITLAMLWLGLWQMQVFEDKEDRSAIERAAQPAIPLLEQVELDGTVGDVYGRQVTVTGFYEPSQQVIVQDADGTLRLVTALHLADGRVLPVVRGLSDAEASDPPQGEVEQSGIFLASEAGADHQVASGRLASVRVPLLAQLWPEQLLPGFLTLDSDDARSQGLVPATATLPSGEGSLQNAGYALQWWVFAAFAAFMTIRFVRAVGAGASIGSDSAVLPG